MKYKNLFSPISINGLKIKNRIAYPSLGLLYSYERKLNDRYYNFFREIAKGGAGIVTVGPVGIDFIGSGIATLALDKDEDIPAFKKLTDIIKEEGASPWIQLFHAGTYTYPMLINNQQPLGPSAVYSNYSKTTPKEMSIEDIDTVKKAYADAAARAKEAGFEGFEILASAGYLITQFLSPLKNKRKDQYGGCFKNRIRFPKEVIKLVRESVGVDVPVTIRMAGNDFVPESNSDIETPAIAREYEKSGVDMINVTGGWHESKIPQLPMELPRTGYAYLALNIRKAVSIPVMASNRIAQPDLAEEIITEGYADMVNLGRVLIADPFWPEKAMTGRADEIRPCVACSQGCTDELFNGRPVMCIGNPRAGFEGERTIKKTESPKKILVAGAGPAGLEAAIVAAQSGHDVLLYEKKEKIGGQIHIAGTPPHKKELWEYERYYESMIKKYNVPVHLNCELTPEIIKKINPDHVIVAEGAEPLVPPVDGIEGSGVISSWNVLENKPMLGKKVAVIGGGAVGLETAMFIAERGTLSPEMLHFLFSHDAAEPKRLKELIFEGSSEVTLFEMMPKAGKDVGKSTRWILMNAINKYGVDVRTNSKVLSIDDGTITFEREGEIKKEKFDNIVVAAGSKSVTKLSLQLEELGIPHTKVGDCVTPAKINNAVHGGFLAAYRL